MSPNRPDLPEDELLTRARQGDREAFGDLYERHLDAIYRYVFYRVEDAADAEDLTETVFLKAWNALAGYRPGEVPFSAWLYRIAHNAIIDRHRTRKAHLPLDAQTMLADNLDSPEDQLDLKQRVEALVKAMRRLRPTHQQVLTLRFIGGLSHAETGRVLRRSEAAVRVLQHRALSELREQMKGRTPDDG
jgi:RNA polymerase sigma-70 factor (ECF subfamily)